MADTDIEVRLPVFAWMQTQTALHVRMKDLFEARGDTTKDSFERGVVDAAIEAVDIAAARIGQALYPVEDWTESELRLAAGDR
jgi:hypothetical protein